MAGYEAYSEYVCPHCRKLNRALTPGRIISTRPIEADSRQVGAIGSDMAMNGTIKRLVSDKGFRLCGCRGWQRDTSFTSQRSKAAASISCGKVRT